MKQWLYNGWFTFKAWVLFNYWRHLTNEDANELQKLYYLKRWEERAMKAYVEHINGRKYEEPESWYIGTIPDNYMERYNTKIKEKNNE